MTTPEIIGTLLGLAAGATCVGAGWYLRIRQTTTLLARVAARSLFLDSQEADLKSYALKLEQQYRTTLELSAKLRGACDLLEKPGQALAARDRIRHIRGAVPDVPPPPKGPLQ